MAVHTDVEAATFLLSLATSQPRVFSTPEPEHPKPGLEALVAASDLPHLHAGVCADGYPPAKRGCQEHNADPLVSQPQPLSQCCNTLQALLEKDLLQTVAAFRTLLERTAKADGHSGRSAKEQ